MFVTYVTFCYIQVLTLMHAYLDTSMLFRIGAKKTTDSFVTERLCFYGYFSAIYFYLLRVD